MRMPITHATFTEAIGAYLAGGLTDGQRADFEAHAASCRPCAEELARLRDSDEQMLSALADVRPGVDFETRTVTALKEQLMHRPLVHPMAKRLGLGIAAALVLGTTGLLANYVVQNDVLNNPMSRYLNPGKDAPALAMATDAELEKDTLERGDGGDDQKWKRPSGVVAKQEIASESTLSVSEARAELKPFQRSGGGKDANELAFRTKEIASGNGAVGSDDGRSDILKARSPVIQGDSTSLAEGLRPASAVTDRADGTPTGVPVYAVRELLVQNEAKALDRNLEAGYFQPGALAAVTKTEKSQEAVTGVRFEERSGEDGKNQGWKDSGRGRLARAEPVDTPVRNAPPTTQPAGASTGGTPAATVQEVANRKIIRSGTMEVEVRSYEDASATLADVAAEEKGYVSSASSERLANGKIRGTVVLRVPPERLDRMLLKLRAMGDIKTQQIAAADVTKQYTDLESELRALRAMEERLINIIKSGKGEVKDLIEAEKQLSEYRVRIEKLEGEIRYYNNLVAMSTLTVTLYEKDIAKPAQVIETEVVNATIETEDVEARYREARKAVGEIKGQIVESELKKQDAGQLAARIVADVPPDKADFLAAQLKGLGNVIRMEANRRQTNAGGTEATSSAAPKVEQKDTRFVITMYNLANIAPRRTNVMNIVVSDVDAAYRAILDKVRQEVKDDAGKAEAVGRIVSSNLSGQKPEQMTADIRADVKSTEAAAVLAALRSTGEILAQSVSESADTANVTAAKTGFQIRLISLAAVPSREATTMSAATPTVAEAYRRLTGAIAELPSNATRVISTQLIEQDAQNVSAYMDFEMRSTDRAAIDRAMSDAGLDIVSRTVARVTDTNATDQKTRYQVTFINAAQLPVKRTTTQAIEVADVEKALLQVRSAAQGIAAREVDYALAEDASGKTVGRLIIEVPAGQADKVLAVVNSISGDRKVNQVNENRQVADTRYARERIEVSFTNRAGIVPADQGFSATVRNAVASSAAALLWSLYLIITGVLFVGPWLLLLWVLWKVLRRRNAARVTA